MNQAKQFNPIPWAVSIGIIVLCVAAAVSITGSCQPARFEFFQLMKTELGGCSRKDVMPSNKSLAQTSSSDPAVSEDNQDESNSIVNLDADVLTDSAENAPPEPLVPIDISQVKVGEVYYLTNKIHPNLFNAPLHGNKPRWGRVAPVIGALEADKVFSVTDKVSTFSGYKWLKIKAVSRASEQIEGWLPWGAKETPVIKSDS